jgi:hypothetical protein
VGAKYPVVSAKRLDPPPGRQKTHRPLAGVKIVFTPPLPFDPVFESNHVPHTFENASKNYFIHYPEFL